jgi:hypothetical protein
MFWSPATSVPGRLFRLLFSIITFMSFGICQVSENPQEFARPLRAVRHVSKPRRLEGGKPANLLFVTMPACSFASRDLNRLKSSHNDFLLMRSALTGITS